MPLLRSTATAALATLVLSACGSDSDPAPTSTTDAPLPASTAEVEIDGVTWSFAVNCAETGPDAVRIWGPGRSPVDDEPSQVLIEATVPDPYVAVTAGSEILEAAFDSPLLVTIAGDTVTITDIDFVANADLATGEGTPAGAGRVTATCATYVAPPDD